MKIVQSIALILTIVGALNWGLIGLFNFNLVTMLFGEGTLVTNIVYILVGIAGLVNIGLLFDLFDIHM